MNIQEFKKRLLGIAKTEIHLHLEALATVDSIWTLMQKNALSYEGVKTKADLVKKFNVTNLDEFLFLFINIIQNSFKSEDDLEYLVQDAGTYLEANNIIYAEIFFAPTKFVQMGFDFKKIVDVLSGAARKIKEKYNREIVFLIDVSRTFGVENAMHNLDLILQHRIPEIIGIGLGGAEAKGPAKEYASVYEKALANGLHAVAHAGEDVGPESIWDALNYLKSERIGHGVSAIQDDALITHLAKTQTPIEVCPTSNLFTQKYVKKIEEHPVRAFFERGLNVTINSDDPTLFSTGLIDEYALLYEHGIFSEDETMQLIKNGIYATFLPQERKDDLWRRVRK